MRLTELEMLANIHEVDFKQLFSFSDDKDMSYFNQKQIT